jgi:hypothetical protein
MKIFQGAAGFDYIVDQRDKESAKIVKILDISKFTDFKSL